MGIGPAVCADCTSTCLQSVATPLRRQVSPDWRGCHWFVSDNAFCYRRWMLSSLKDPVDASVVRRALVIKLRHHGDVLLTSPVFTVLKRAASGAEIDALVYLDTAPMLEGHPAIAAIHTIDRNWKRKGLLAQ